MPCLHLKTHDPLPWSTNLQNVYLNTLQKDLEEDDWEEVEFQLKKKKLGTSIPRDEDLHGAAQALIRLQDVYELDIRDLSKGRN